MVEVFIPHKLATATKQYFLFPASLLLNIWQYTITIRSSNLQASQLLYEIFRESYQYLHLRKFFVED
jgi:hypothetical protein